MKEPIWIRDDVVRAIHSRQLSEHGGQEGIRDEGLLDSALTRPRSKLNYSSSEPDLAELAASYAYGLSQNHPFIDGNKRTAYVACRTFLILNGRDIVAPQEEKVLIFLQLAA
ncbi:MAG: type II toxin-antitoxin system death-on-curing family toxin, partial [Planctomycetota bacterium]